MQISLFQCSGYFLLDELHSKARRQSWQNFLKHRIQLDMSRKCNVKVRTQANKPIRFGGLVDLEDILEGFLQIRQMIKAQSKIFEQSKFRIIASSLLITKQFGKMRSPMAFFSWALIFFGQFNELQSIYNTFSRRWICSGPNTNSIHSRGTEMRDLAHVGLKT